ncbi:MAG: PEGA domain-containing protein [Pseudomonadota bacterium]
MKNLKNKLLPLLFLAALASPAAVHAEGYDAAKVDQAKVYMEEGQQHFLAGRFNEAAITFMKAYSVLPLSAFLFNTAIAYEKLKMWKHAAEFMERYIDAEPDATDRESIVEKIAALKAKPETEYTPPDPEADKGNMKAVGQTEFDAAKVEQARVHMEKGQEFYLAGKYDEAAITFMKAYSVLPLSAFLFNLGASYEKMMKWKHAASFYEQYLDAEPESPDRDGILEKIKELKTKPEHVPDGSEAEPAPVSSAGEMKSLINVRVHPPDAKVIITAYPDVHVADGESPLAQTLEEGRYKVTVEHPKFKTVDTMVDVSGGRIYVIVVEMSQGQFLGYLNIRTSAPNAKVYLDDKDAGIIGKTPIGKPLPQGQHKLWIELAGYEPMEKDIEIKLGDETTLDIQLERVEYGIFAVKTNTGEGRVIFDKKTEKEKTEAAPFEGKLSPGLHNVFVDAKGMKSIKEAITIERGSKTSLLVRLNPKPKRTSAYVSFALMGVFLAAGAALAYYSYDEMGNMQKDADLGILAADDKRQDKGLGLAIGADAGFVLGGLCAILGLYYILRDPLPDSESKVEGPVDLADIENNGK